MRQFYLTTLLLLIFCSACTTRNTGDLRCEYVTDPIGIDISSPRLSWKMTSGGKGEAQTSYQIEVASSLTGLNNGKADMWNSGEVTSAFSNHIEYKGEPLQSGKTYYWRVKIADQKGKWGGWSQPASWTMALGKDGWQSQWITGDYDNERTNSNSPWFRKEFKLDAKADRAIVTVTSDNYFELYLNGRKVGDDVLTPAVKNPKAPMWAISYDVVEYLQAGENCIGLWLGQGWGPAEQRVKAQLNTEVAGKEIIIGTDNTWQTSKSQLTSNDHANIGTFGGDHWDARMENENWCKVGSQTGQWKQAVEIEVLPTGNDVKYQPCPTNRISKNIQAIKITPMANGNYEIDFGTNLVGWVELKMRGLQQGDTVKIALADTRSIGSKIQKTPAGDIRIFGWQLDSAENMQGTKNYYQSYGQRNTYISAGRTEETFCNKFNYGGFRYALIEGLKSEPALSDIIGLHIESDLPQAGDFECSDQLINDIHKLNAWTLKCLDLGGYMVDCPTREKLGYGGDEQATIDGMLWNHYPPAFYEKMMYDWRGAQSPTGNLPNVAPILFTGGGGIPWPGIVFVAPWKHYLHYGSDQILKDNYQMALNYVLYLDSRADESDIIQAWGTEFAFLGDWLLPWAGMDTKGTFDEKSAEVFCNCFRVYLWNILGNIAGVIGDQGEVSRCRERERLISEAVQKRYYDPEKKIYKSDDQNNYLMPLFTGITPESEREAVMAGLMKNINEKYHGHFDTGMMGTIYMLEYLHEIGRDDMILAMYQSKEFPGWGYMLVQGATTVWEQWNGYFSQIHSCFASADNWLYSGLAGINPDPANPGFKRVIIDPAAVGDISWVKAHHDSPYGRISVNWERKGDQFTLELTVPANSTALVFLPVSGDGNSVKESGKELKDAEYCEFKGVEGGKAVVEVSSGTYKFSSTMPR